MESKASREIDVLAIIRKVLSRKKELCIFLSVFFTLGLIVALTQQKKFTSYVTLAPEATSMGMSQNLSDIAGAIGVDIGGGNSSVDAIYPDIYPDVFASIDFVVKLFDIPVNVKGITKTYYAHLKEDTKIPFWNYPSMWLTNMFAKKDTTINKGKTTPYCLTTEQDAICNAIIKNVGCQINKGTNVITISVTDTDAKVAACLADTVKNRLQEYITLYRTQKARQDLSYAKRINAEAKAAYEKARQKYSAFADANMDVQLMSYQSKMEDLENDMQLKFNSYSQTAQQVQKAEEKIQENTPAFTVIQNASVPLRPSSMPRSMTIVIYLFVGLFVDVLWVLGLSHIFHRNNKK